jgi:murein hydrolase activator
MERLTSRYLRSGLLVSLLVLIVVTDGVPQTAYGSGANPGEEITRRQHELATIRKEIESFERKIEDSRKSERESAALLENIDRQKLLVHTYIRDLRAEEQKLVRSIDTARRSIRELESEIDQLRTQYARYVRSAYKHGTAKDVELLLTASSVNQFLVRAEYLRRFSQQRRTDLRAIQEKQLEVRRQEEQLAIALREQRNILNEKQQEEKRLADRSVERRNVLNRIRQDRTMYERELARQQDAERRMQQLIAELIERERIRRERDADRVREGMAAEIVPPTVAFATKKGSLPWPVREGQIAARFGEQVHPVLKTVSENTGVDIAVEPGSPVYAVAEGDVAIIMWMPYYGNVIMVHHYDGYRTVYANLSEILVAENDRVHAGDMIATSGESVRGSTIHFEVWKDREKQNPEAWLQSR